MNLYFRLLRTLFVIFFQSRTSFEEEVRMEYLVWPNDLDLNMHMNNGRYLTLMDLGRLQLMARTGLAKHILKNRWMPVLGGANIRFRRPLAPFQRFTLTTRLVSWDEKWFYIEHRFLVKEEIMAVATVRAAIVGKGKSLPTSVFTNLLGIQGGPPEAPPIVIFGSK